MAKRIYKTLEPRPKQDKELYSHMYDYMMTQVAEYRGAFKLYVHQIQTIMVITFFILAFVAPAIIFREFLQYPGSFERLDNRFLAHNVAVMVAIFAIYMVCFWQLKYSIEIRLRSNFAQYAAEFHARATQNERELVALLNQEQYGVKVACWDPQTIFLDCLGCMDVLDSRIHINKHGLQVYYTIKNKAQLECLANSVSQNGESHEKV